MKKLILIALVSILTACGSTPNREVVKEVELVPVVVPTPLLTKCKATAPIPPSEFIKMTSEKKEEALTDLVVKLYTDIKNCNEQIDAVSKYQTKQIELMKEKQK